MPKVPSDNKNTSMARFREKKHHSVAPYYVIAISWIIFAICFPMYTVGHFITIILISIAEFVILRKLIKPKIERIPLPYTAPRSGIEDVDRTIDAGADYIRRFDRISAELSTIDTGLAAKLTEIRELMNQIFEHVSTHPDKLTRIRRFMNYYLPTLEKLMNTYLELSNQRTKGENIKKTLTSIEEILDVIKPAFERLLNDLYEDRAIDVYADISVLESMLKSDGLSSVKADISGVDIANDIFGADQ